MTYASLLREIYIDIGGPENRWFDLDELIKAAYAKDPTNQPVQPNRSAQSTMQGEIEAGRVESKLLKRRNKVNLFPDRKSTGSTRVRKYRRLERPGIGIE